MNVPDLTLSLLKRRYPRFRRSWPAMGNVVFYEDDSFSFGFQNFINRRLMR